MSAVGLREQVQTCYVLFPRRAQVCFFSSWSAMPPAILAFSVRIPWVYMLCAMCLVSAGSGNIKKNGIKPIGMDRGVDALRGEVSLPASHTIWNKEKPSGFGTQMGSLISQLNQCP